MIKLIALDLDNTLLDTNLEIPSDVVELLQKCTEQGIVITIATGWNCFRKRMLLKQLYHRAIK